jgi:hypothetical protein
VRIQVDCRTVVARIVLLSVGMIVLPACSATAGHKWLRREGNVVAPPSGNVVYRPAYPALRTKPLYLPNYAGVVYPPVRPRPPLEPTMMTAPRPRPFARWFGAYPVQP